VFRAQPWDAVYASPARPALVALTLAVLFALRLAHAALGADPSPVLIDPLDPRAEGEGPGVVGAPLVAALAVIAIGLLAVVATAVYVRLNRPG
jgi:hypothetical protein